VVVLVLSTRHHDGRFEKKASILVFGDDEALVAATRDNDPAAMVCLDEITHELSLSHFPNVGIFN